MQNLVERFFYHFQVWLMRKKRTREIVTPHLIAFHPKDAGKEVLKEFKKRLDKFS